MALVVLKVHNLTIIQRHIPSPDKIWFGCGLAPATCSNAVRVEKSNHVPLHILKRERHRPEEIIEQSREDRAMITCGKNAKDAAIQTGASVQTYDRNGAKLKREAIQINEKRVARLWRQ